MRIIVSLLFSLLFLVLSAQTNIKFAGLVYDSKGNSIPFATVSMKKNFVATTTNIEGNYKLVVSLNSLPDTLIVRHISFETKKFYLDKSNIKLSKNITLQTKNNEIALITVTAKSAKQIIELVINNIENNYNSESYFLDGFYRQKHKENNKYVRLIECEATIQEQISKRSSEEQKESFLIKKIRRSNVYEQNGDKHGDHFVDLLSENPINYTKQSFLNSTNIHNYDFKYISSENNQFYKIYFQNKVWKVMHNKSGYALINKDDYAIVEMKIVSTNNPNKLSDNTSKWRFQNGTYFISFEKKGTKYFCKESSKYYNHYVLDDNLIRVNYIVEEYFEWFTFEFEKYLEIEEDPEDSHGMNTHSVNKYNKLSNLYSKDYKYNSLDWEKENYPKIEEKLLLDLNSFKDLEKQYIDD